jgi:hypothetical protein
MSATGTMLPLDAIRSADGTAEARAEKGAGLRV